MGTRTEAITAPPVAIDPARLREKAGLKRVLLGPALPTAHLIHERLGKVTALAIFSSDALSSVAYASEEMLKTLFIAGFGAVAFSLVMPLTLAIVGVLAILIFSYRQTIKAYPSAGGAYIVTKDNFGLLPAQVAGVALLTDYVLTVAVSVSAGVAAIIAAAPGLHVFRVPMAVAFICLIALGNLRGVRESGKIFAAPTYLFIFSIVSMIVIGLTRLATGSLEPGQAVATGGQGLGLLAGVPLFIALHALASGSAAMTGVEAISNGVPAFKPPEWRNAQKTLTAMGLILGTMFVGISFLASRLEVAPDFTGKSTVLADIGKEVFGQTGIGYVAFLVLQVATTLILVLAANTAFADFPRLANFHADDNFLPRQFTTRGHRLVFSNGIIALAAAAVVIVVIFRADVTRLIPFYAIGVFTSFSLSQAGMAKRHLRLREPGWKLGLVINGAGAVATAVVLVVISITKFAEGAWAVMVLVPVLVWLLMRMNHQYERERGELEEDLQSYVTIPRERPMALLLVRDVDARTIHALQYAKTLRAETLAVHLEDDPMHTLLLEAAWHQAGLHDSVPLRIARGSGDEAGRLAGFVGALPVERDITVLVPVAHDVSALERLSESRDGTKLTRALLPYEHVRVTLVRDHPDSVHPLSHDEQGNLVVKLTPRGMHTSVVLVDKLDRAVLRAVAYALTLGATEVRAVHAAVDPDRAMHLADAWMSSGVPVALDVVECWDRNVPRTLEEEVIQLGHRGAEVTVVMPRRDFPKLRQRLLHDRTSRRIIRRLGHHPHVDVAAVPYYFAPRTKAARALSTPTSVG
ncbi:MAG: APC family permease [Actinomycetota bacterium]